ncbi:hypothetical protein MTZ88_001572 [Salmonella enterica]|nr:hypothetical protein [Salmonella enterica]
MAMQQRYFKLNEADSVKYHKEYQEQIGKPRKKAIRDFLDTCNAVGYYSHQSFGVPAAYTLMSLALTSGHTGETAIIRHFMPVTAHGLSRHLHTHTTPGLARTVIRFTSARTATWLLLTLTVMKRSRLKTSPLTTL